ncbi:MAG: hypothetical protein GY861_05745 [bacterium]|nr:hypothetical protein [bacterium]
MHATLRDLESLVTVANYIKDHPNTKTTDIRNNVPAELKPEVFNSLVILRLSGFIKSTYHKADENIQQCYCTYELIDNVEHHHFDIR